MVAAVFLNLQKYGLSLTICSITKASQIYFVWINDMFNSIFDNGHEALVHSNIIFCLEIWVEEALIYFIIKCGLEIYLGWMVFSTS